MNKSAQQDNKRRRSLNLPKLTRYAITINICQIVAVCALAGYSLIMGDLQLSGWISRSLTIIAALMVIWGAALDIREARMARKSARQRQMLEEAYAHLETLNATLRAQRHDFTNHIQVIYTLTELDDRASALEYMDRVYGDIQKVGRALKTASPAVNALLAAKLADCEENGVQFTTDIRTDWKNCSVPGWEMCRMLGNLIDNAVEALDPAGEKRICVRMWEDVRLMHFSVENNGAPIPDEIQKSIFEEGYSTKGEGRGTGLFIVSRILEANNGSIRLECADGVIRFHCSVPHAGSAEI